MRCQQCGLVYTNPQVDTERLSQLYERSTYTYEGEERYIRRTYQRELARLVPLLRERDTPLSLSLSLISRHWLRQRFHAGCGQGTRIR